MSCSIGGVKSEDTLQSLHHSLRQGGVLNRLFITVVCDTRIATKCLVMGIGFASDHGGVASVTHFNGETFCPFLNVVEKHVRPNQVVPNTLGAHKHNLSPLALTSKRPHDGPGLKSQEEEEGEATPSNGGGDAADDDDSAGVAEDEAKLSEIYGRLGQIGAASAEARAATILSGLGFSTEVQVRKIGRETGIDDHRRTTREGWDCLHVVWARGGS